MIQVETKGLLEERLDLVFDWYKGMINRYSGRLEYLYLPDTDTFVREKCPIRDIASVWDVEVLSDFLHRDDLRPLVKTSLEYYKHWLTEQNGCLILDSDRLDEPSSIAHSAFMLLALLHDSPKSHAKEISGLAEGIARQQRPDGSFKVYFEEISDSGEELYSGEAMLALLEFDRASGEKRSVRNVARALEYYDAHYFLNDRVGDDLLVFFANWQSQAAGVLVELADPTLKHRTIDYVFRMHDRIIDQGFYADAKHRPAKLISVEVACALEGLNDAFALAETIHDNQRLHEYRKRLCNGLSYLLDLQTVHGAKRACGGFGVSFSERTQRIDITGHAASAFIKSLENKIECEA